jgi:hypothetical protein
LNPRLCTLMVRKWSTGPISLSYTTPLVQRMSEKALQHEAQLRAQATRIRELQAAASGADPPLCKS